MPDGRLYENLRIFFPDVSSCAGWGQIPIINPVREISIRRWLPFNVAINRQIDRETGIHMFLHDYQFERLWNTPNKYIPLLQKAGAVNVMVLTNEGKDALLACSEGIYKGLLVRRRKPVSMVGTGDALVGGFLMNCLRSAGAVESFRYGCCCAAATAYVRGFADRAMADELAEKFTVTCLEKGTSKA